MSAVASLISETGVFSLSHAVDLDHYGGTKSSTRAILSELPTIALAVDGQLFQ